MRMRKLHREWRGEATPQIQASAESQQDGRSHGREQTPGLETNPAVMLACQASS